tara:strand:+ start:21034 stop:21204 length:171 start_codon:yes stop_codon:yes gene_type:complete
MENTKKFRFCLYLWDETGNILLDTKRQTLRRAEQSTARSFLKRKYPMYEIEQDGIY